MTGPIGTVFYISYLVLILVFGAGFAFATHALAFLPVLAQGLVVTLEITAISALLGISLAFVSGLTKLYGPRLLRWIASLYIEFFRGTSALVQLFWLYFVLPQFGVELSAMSAAILALGFHIGAYGAEIVRGAVAAVPRSQWEAAIALNLSPSRSLWRIILPQAVTAMIPIWENLMIELLKLTSLVSLITLADLTFRAQQLNLATFRTPEIFTLILAIYLAVSLLLTIAIRALSARLDRRFGRSK